MNKYKLIVADIDGTITASDHTTSKRNINTIQKLRNDGYLFGLASGRPVEDIMNKYLEWNLEKQFDFLIGWNGCQLYDSSTSLQYNYNYLSTEDIKEIIELMEEFDCTINMYAPGIYLSSKETDRAWYSAFKNKRTFVVEEKIDNYYKNPNGGIMFRTTLSQMPIIEDKITKLKNKNYIGFKTQVDLMEFAHKDCNKGYALKKYCELHNIDLNDCIAFGDTTNDNEMLKCCFGVCLLNGSDDTKACAKAITEIDCDYDGFSDYVDKNILKGKFIYE